MNPAHNNKGQKDIMSITTKTVDLNRFKNAVGLVVTFSARWGNTRKGNMAGVKLAEGADANEEQKAKQRVALRKQLIVSKEYDAIKSFQGEIRSWIYTRTVPSFFKEGFQLCGLGEVSNVNARLKKARVELAELVKAFIAVYPEQIEAARAVLEPVGQFNPGDYPPAEALESAFDISWNWIAFTVPEGLPAELRQQEEEKLSRQFEDAGQQITAALRVAFGELIAHATERLTDSPDGKKKKIYDSVVGNLSDFIDTFNSRNITNDAELAVLVGKAREILVGVTPQKLRDYANQRDNIRQQFEGIKAAIDPMIVAVKSRKFEFDLDDKPAEPASAAA